jgi:uncharacterized protein
MSTGPIPDRIDAARLFARFGRIDAAIPVARLQRLIPYLAGADGQAVVNLQFGLDPEGRKLLTGSIVANLALACQRCLQSMQLPVNSELSLLVFSDRKELEQQMSLQTRENLEQDVLVLDEMQVPAEGVGQELDLLALIEDELILSLPLAPMHEDVNCSKAWVHIRDQELREDKGGAGGEGGGSNPFAMLAKLKKDIS